VEIDMGLNVQFVDNLYALKAKEGIKNYTLETYVESLPLYGERKDIRPKVIILFDKNKMTENEFEEYIKENGVVVSEGILHQQPCGDFVL
jgi:hypothetical protein